MSRIISMLLFVVINCSVVKAGGLELTTATRTPGFNIIYDPENGKLGWMANSEMLTRLEIKSAGNLFLGDVSEFTYPDGSPLYGGNGIYNSGTIILENENGFPPGRLFGNTQVFARVAPFNTGAALLADWSVSGMVLSDRQLCDVTGGAWLVAAFIPEPTSHLFIGFSVLSLFCFRRRHST